MTKPLTSSGLHIRAGMTVGLLGGSFDPPHSGHVHITKEALKRFGLDRVVWLVSPGNPLKSNGPAPIDKRLTASRRIMTHPRVIVSDAEARLGTRFTAETLEVLMALHPGVHFVWLMGADNLVQFHRWERWRSILEAVPVGVIARPGERTGARRSKAARMYRAERIAGRAARLLPRAEAPAWCFLNVPMADISSTAIRARGGWSK